MLFSVLPSSSQTPNEIDVPLHAWYRQLAALPIDHITWLQGQLIGRPQSMNPLLKVLPSMVHLTSLDLSHSCVSSLDDLFSYIRDSKLTQLCLQDVTTVDPATSEPVPGSLSRQSVNSITHWLATQPVTRFGLGNWTMPTTPKVLSQFYHALWTCPSLWAFFAHKEPFPSLSSFDFSVPFALHQLSLTQCDLTSEDVSHLARGLAESTVTWLNLSDNPRIGSSGVRALATTALRTSAVTMLCLNHVTMGSLGCSHLAHVLGDTRVTELCVDSNGIGDGGALFLGYVMRMSPSLRSLSMQHNAISISGAMGLLQSLSSRTVTSTSPLVIDLDGNPIDDVDQNSLDVMASKQLPHDAIFSCVSDFEGPHQSVW
ncbi:hypothetical protein DYB32_002453 [Aphanomyces invadans]|uniref:RNI-like protein n=1 Tax=Aphanomyces invadans TaxID=157072 RepID=A0A418B3F9_9STRA|nr:hypothetical protein DYB32_002453 [Aphanomyces invadans]